MNDPVLVMALYKPKPGKTTELEALLQKHYPLLTSYGLTTGQRPFIARSSEGTLIEIFEWISPEGARKAPDHPAVAKIWEAMAMVCDFQTLEGLSEAKKVFPQFQRAFGGQP